MEIVSFARSKDATRYNLAGCQLEPSRIVATDGHRLAWQEFTTGEGSEHGILVNDAFAPIDGEFPDYKAVLPGSPNIVFHVSTDGDWLPALKAMARLSEQPWGSLECGGDRKILARLETQSPDIKCALRIELAGGDPKPFKLGINLAFVHQALEAAKRSDGRGRWYARIAIVDHLTAVTIDNTNGFYSITMPCRCDGAFVTKPQDSQQAA
jgi:DNA polymerase III sliding clamp (beta) subunit (PCNA family)